MNRAQPPLFKLWYTRFRSNNSKTVLQWWVTPEILSCPPAIVKFKLHVQIPLTEENIQQSFVFCLASHALHYVELQKAKRTFDIQGRRHRPGCLGHESPRAAYLVALARFESCNRAKREFERRLGDAVKCTDRYAFSIGWIRNLDKTGPVLDDIWRTPLTVGGSSPSATFTE